MSKWIESTNYDDDDYTSVDDDSVVVFTLSDLKAVRRELEKELHPCPKCNGKCERGERPMGIGMMLGPYTCTVCGWSELEDECEHGCHYKWPYGFVIMCDCPIHDVPLLNQIPKVQNEI